MTSRSARIRPSIWLQMTCLMRFFPYRMPVFIEGQTSRCSQSAGKTSTHLAELFVPPSLRSGGTRRHGRRRATLYSRLRYLYCSKTAAPFPLCRVDALFFQQAPRRLPRTPSPFAATPADPIHWTGEVQAFPIFPDDFLSLSMTIPQAAMVSKAWPFPVAEEVAYSDKRPTSHRRKCDAACGNLPRSEFSTTGLA